MKTLLLAAAFLLACPADLKTKTSTKDTSAVEPPPPPILGVNERPDCDQAAIGSTVCDLVLQDHNDEYWRLYDHKGKVIVLDFSTAWCYPCQRAAPHAQLIQDDYGDQIVFVTLLLQGESGLPATIEDVTAWRDTYGMTTSPVLQASDEYVKDPNGITGYLVGGYPTYVYIDQELKIHTGHVGFSDEYARLTLDGLLAN